jgi:Protein of unknown function DUF262
MNEKEIDFEENSFYEDDFDQQPPPDIVAYNELRSCADLVRMFQKGILNIQPDFQRDIVWKTASQTRFVDSLIKQLPIPSMCFSLDFKTQKWQVIDGLQRMTSIIRFLTSTDWRLSALEDIDPNISGKRVIDFRNESSSDYILYQRVENLTLPITVIRCDYSKKNHMEYLFTIFHRLNSGGTKLNNQEIRNCIFSGEFNTLLKELNEYPAWRQINRMGDSESERFKHVEIILRFFAFIDEYDKYSGVLSKFLNEYMRKNRNPNENFIQEKELLFKKVSSILNKNLSSKLTEKLGISILEALMFGTAKNLPKIEAVSDDEFSKKYLELKNHEYLSSSYLSGGIGKKDKVNNRLTISSTIFSK